jgi:hypothetical protein
MTLRENVLKLQETELKAAPGLWQKWHQTGIDGTEYCIRLRSGYNIIGINECDQNAIVDLRNAARELLDVLSRFKEGDAKLLSDLIYIEEESAKFAAGFGKIAPEMQRMIDMLKRLQEGARGMEE